MATDPVKRIREYDFATPFRSDIATPLARLAQLPPSLEAPYLTVCLDWRPDEGNPGQRSARATFDKEIAALIAAAGPRGTAHDSLTADAKRISAFLDTEVDPAAQGVFVVSSSANGVFMPLMLGLAVPTFIVAAPTPHLSELARFAEDHPTYAVLLADQRDAYLTIITQASPDQGVYLESSLYPRRQSQGGNAKERYQRRADERVAAFARAIAGEVGRALDDAGVDLLIIAGDEIITSALSETLDRSVQERVVARIRLDAAASPHQVIAATLPLVAQVEREREAAAVDRLRETLGGGLAVAGAVDVANALQANQVGLLIMNDDFHAAGWADYAHATFGVGAKPAQSPLGGDASALASVDLDEEFVRVALATGAEIEIVHSSAPVAPDDGSRVPAGQSAPKSEPAARLDEVGGVGAILRFASR